MPLFGWLFVSAITAALLFISGLYLYESAKDKRRKG